VPEGRGDTEGLSEPILGSDMTQIHKKMTMDANFKGSSQQAKEDSINRRNGQGLKHLKFFLLFFSKLRPKPNKPKPKPMFSSSTMPRRNY